MGKPERIVIGAVTHPVALFLRQGKGKLMITIGLRQKSIGGAAHVGGDEEDFDVGAHDCSPTTISRSLSP